jgi:hypothetical protein
MNIGCRAEAAASSPLALRIKTATPRSGHRPCLPKNFSSVRAWVWLSRCRSSDEAVRYYSQQDPAFRGEIMRVQFWTIVVCVAIIGMTGVMVYRFVYPML